MPPLEERPEYPYQNIRVKNFPWGDGDKVSSIRLGTWKYIYMLTCFLFLLDYLVGFSLLFFFFYFVFHWVANFLVVKSWNPNVNYHNEDKVTG